MPLVRVQTSVAVDEAARGATMKSLSWFVSEILQKPESYVMVVLEPEVPMVFSALPDPSAFVEVRSVGEISEEQARDLSGKISEILGQEIGVGAGRIFLNCISVAGSMWGFDGKTLG